jgi:hypothetical protein
MSALITQYTSPAINSTSDLYVLDIDGYTYLSYQASLTGSLAGTLQLWVSNDNKTYIHKTDADLSVSGGQAYMVDILGIGTAYVKWVMDVNSGSGSVHLVPCAKGIG